MKFLIIALMALSPALSLANSQIVDEAKGDVCNLTATMYNTHIIMGMEFTGDSANLPYASFAPLLPEEYQSLFEEKTPRTLDTSMGKYTSIRNADSTYEVRYKASGLLNRHYKNYLHTNIVMTYDSQGELLQIDAKFEEKWPFPSSIWSNEKWEAVCRF